MRNILNFKRPLFWVCVVIAFTVMALAIILLMNPTKNMETQVDEEHIVQGEVSDEYSVYDGNLIKFADFPIGTTINRFILEVENMLFEVDPSDFEKYGGGRVAEIKYIHTDVNYFYEIESITPDGNYIKSEKQRQVYGIISISGDPHTVFD